MGGRVPDEMRAQLKRIMTSESSVPVMMYYLEYVVVYFIIEVHCD
jgi:anaphase-promoting complex subunit 5